MKSFEKDTILDELDPGIRTFSIDPMSLQKRANRLVQRAAEQLLPYVPTGVPMLIMLDNYRQKGISLDEHTLAALFGELKVRIEIDPTTEHAVSEAWLHVDDGSPLAAVGIDTRVPLPR